MSGNAREPGRSTIDRVLSLLNVIDARDLTLTEIAERAQIPHTTTSRILSALESWGGVERSERGTYQIGLRLWEVGARASSASALREAARPAMQQLVEMTRENVQLAVLDQGAALVIERLHGSNAIRTVTQIGRRLPLHATAVGRVLLAHAGTDVVREICAGRPKRYTPYTQVMPGHLAAALQDVRRQGWAYTCEELTMGAASLAAPVRDESGRVIAAIAVVARSRTDLVAMSRAVVLAGPRTAASLRVESGTSRAS